MHANRRGGHAAQALPLAIEYLRAEGYRLVAASQLVRLEPSSHPCISPIPLLSESLG